MIFLDANIFMYAAGRESPQRAPCQAFLTRVVSNPGTPACTDAEVLQEILHRYRTIEAPAVGFRVFDSVMALGLPVHAVGPDEVRRARALLKRWPRLSTRDAVHLGVTEAHGLRDVLSYDKDFDAVPWVRRAEPSVL